MNRPSTIRDRGYWDRPFARDDSAEMARKYARLLKAVRDRVPARRDRALREIAETWPGSLRECQLVAPPVVAARLRAARRGAADRPWARRHWDQRGFAAVPLWADLHALIRDLLGWRRSGGRGTVPDFLAALAPSARVRWPDVALLVSVGGERPSHQVAYAWLAAQAGLPTAALRGLLFDSA